MDSARSLWPTAANRATVMDTTSATLAARRNASKQGGEGQDRQTIWTLRMLELHCYDDTACDGGRKLETRERPAAASGCSGMHGGGPIVSVRSEGARASGTVECAHM